MPPVLAHAMPGRLKRVVRSGHQAMAHTPTYLYEASSLLEGLLLPALVALLPLNRLGALRVPVLQAATAQHGTAHSAQRRGVTMHDLQLRGCRGGAQGV